mmetsp:Transcript_40806/g.95325  ORF Transcript_40806/g.95325 Transcript_40806/m.95325 type:complete len:253 (+) Transcript_40806:1008-1766(+)
MALDTKCMQGISCASIHSRLSYLIPPTITNPLVVLLLPFPQVPESETVTNVTDKGGSKPPKSIDSEMAKIVSESLAAIYREEGTTTCTSTSRRGGLTNDCLRPATANSLVWATFTSCFGTPATSETTCWTLRAACVDLKSASNMFQASTMLIVLAATQTDEEMGAANPSSHTQEQAVAAWTKCECCGMAGQSTQGGAPIASPAAAAAVESQSTLFPTGHVANEHGTHLKEMSLKNPGSHSQRHAASSGGFPL